MGLALFLAVLNAGMVSAGNAAALSRGKLEAGPGRQDPGAPRVSRSPGTQHPGVLRGGFSGSRALGRSGAGGQALVNVGFRLKK